MIHSLTYNSFINLILFLNSSNEEVEEIPQPRHPTPAGMHCASQAHPTSRTSAYLSNGSPTCPTPKTPPSSKAASSSSARWPPLTQAQHQTLESAMPSLRPQSNIQGRPLDSSLPLSCFSTCSQCFHAHLSFFLFIMSLFSPSRVLIMFQVCLISSVYL